jgi:hypothetical protein
MTASCKFSVGQGQWHNIKMQKTGPEDIGRSKAEASF